MPSQPCSKDGCAFRGKADADFISIFVDSAFFVQGKDGARRGWDITWQHPRTQLITVGLHDVLKGFWRRGRLREIHQLGQELENKWAAEPGEEIVHMRHDIYCMFRIAFCIEIGRFLPFFSAFSFSSIKRRFFEALAL